MSDPDESKTPSRNGRARQEVLSSLPRHRPQRLTARRAATRESPAATPSVAKRKPARKTTAPTPKKTPARSTAVARRPPVKRAPPAPGLEKLAPKQGFAAEESVARGSVQPPSGGEMLVSVLHLGGALGRGGVVTGGRLLKGLLSRVPGA